jgi:myosin protein heavy chain
VGGPVTTYAYQEEERNIFPRTVTTTETSRASSTSRALVIAGAGMRRKHSYDTGIGQLEDIEEVDSVLEKDSVLEQAFLEEEADEEFPDIVEEEDDNETLVEVDGELYKEKEVEIEVSDSEAGSDAESDAGPQDGCGVKRKRTIRVVIRSRAFI